MTAERAPTPLRRSRPALPAAPRHLGTVSRRLWRSVVAEYELAPHHLALLERACEALDRIREAQAAIAADGAYIPGRFGLKAHPGLAVEAQCRIAFARIVRELGLDIEAPVTSRPPTRWRD